MGAIDLLRAKRDRGYDASAVPAQQAGPTDRVLPLSPEEQDPQLQQGQDVTLKVTGTYNGDSVAVASVEVMPNPGQTPEPSSMPTAPIMRMDPAPVPG
jgi:hypothetical protein